MKIKLLNSFFIRYSLIVGLAFFSLIPKEESCAQETNLISEVKIGNFNNFKSSKSLFKSFINQALKPLPTPELYIGNISGYIEYNSNRQRGSKTFLRCNNRLNNNGNFEFFNPNLPVNQYFIDQGDSITCTQIEDHNCTLEIDHNTESISCFNAANGFIDVNVNGGRQFTDGSYVYQWSGPKGFVSTQASISNLSIGGLYTLVVADANNCREVLDVFINKPAKLEVDFQVTQVNCFGVDDGTITLFVNGGTPPYTSNFGPGDDTFLFENLEPGIYDIEVMDDNGCIELLEIEIEPDFVNEINPPQGKPFQEFCIEDQPMLSDLNVKGSGVKWYLSPSGYDALPNDHLIAESTILYARNFSESLKCLSSQTLRVEIRIIEGILNVNNFITVNGNNLNEELNVNNMELFPENEMKIYNRYGKLVWKTTNYENTNNTFKGMSNVGGKISQSNFLPKGTYFYILNYKSPCNKNTKKGFIQVENNNG